MQVIFPNPFGGTALPSAQAEQHLQSQHGFSDDLAQFYLRQNGFNAQSIDADSEAAQAFFARGRGSAMCCGFGEAVCAERRQSAHGLGRGDGVQPVRACAFPLAKASVATCMWRSCVDAYQGFIARSA